jgi:cellulose synthase (UDP-forming)
LWGITTEISEIGASIKLTQSIPLALEELETLSVKLEIMEEELQLSGVVTQTSQEKLFSTLQVAFDTPPLEQQRRLVEMLFCRPGQWQRRETPGELRSLFLLFKILLKPRVLFDRRRNLLSETLRNSRIKRRFLANHD